MLQGSGQVEKGGTSLREGGYEMSYSTDLSSLFDVYDLSVARQRLHDVAESGILASSEVRFALWFLDEIEEVITSGTPRELRKSPKGPSSSPS